MALLVQRWVLRCALHSVHSIFPSPDVVQHKGGKDSISKRKVNKGNAQYEPTKEMLGVLLTGSVGADRKVGLPADKGEKYQAVITAALDSKLFRVSMKDFQGILGKVQFACNTMPSMRGHLTPMNQALKGRGPKDFIGLARKSVL